MGLLVLPLLLLQYQIYALSDFLALLLHQSEFVPSLLQRMLPVHLLALAGLVLLLLAVLGAAGAATPIV